MEFVLLPGFMNDASLWDDVRDELGTKGSLSFGDLSQGDQIPQMAYHVLENAPPHFTVIGVSLNLWRWPTLDSRISGRSTPL